MPLLGLTWDPTFLRTRAGMSLALESGVGLVGALIGFVFANGFESFLMWGAFFASGFFLFTHVTNLTQSLESRFPFLAKVVRFLCFCTLYSFILNYLFYSVLQHLVYMAAWCLGVGIMAIYRCVIWSIMGVRLQLMSFFDIYTPLH